MPWTADSSGDTHFFTDQRAYPPNRQHMGWGKLVKGRDPVDSVAPEEPRCFPDKVIGVNVGADADG